MENNTYKSFENFKKMMSYMPFVLFMTFAVIFLSAGVVAFIYTIVTFVAFKSSMVFVILFGCTFLLVGIGLALVDGFVSYKKRFDKKNAPQEEQVQKTTVAKKKFSIKFQTICFGIMVIGAIFVIVSAGLGVTSADNWIDETKGFLADNGYYEKTKSFEISYDSMNPDRPIDKIVFDLDTKNVVIIFTDDDIVTVKGYETFPAQIGVTYGGGTIKVWDNPSPKKNGTPEKMLAFMFEENEAELQIRVYVPRTLKDKVEFVGEYILAQ